jgi:hypothetical protein
MMIIVLGNLQAWDSGVHEAGLPIVLLVSLAIALAAVALLLPLRQTVLLGVLAVAFLLLIAARLTSPVPVSGLFLILIPAIMGLIFTGIVVKDRER